MDFIARQRVPMMCLVLGFLTAALYWPITHHDFVNIDDPRFITQNPHVQAGLTWDGTKWAFHTLDTENWQPLTWLSHMLDCQLFGLNAGGHHLTSLLLHVTNSLLLFLWLINLKQPYWRSVIVAAFFAWHPLHVESVAWACERKDVLSTFFWLLALLTYTRYAQNAGAGTVTPAGTRGQAVLFYALTLLFFACGLMSKPMVVTLPCILLLLDFWPLDRFGFLNSTTPRESNQRIKNAAWLVAEKIPFILLTAGISFATLFAQKAGGALSSLSGMPLSIRVANSLINYLMYLAKTFWPTNLAYFYPYDQHRSMILVLSAALLIGVVTALCLWRRRREPWLLVGWLWFLGTMIPTVGLVHVGIQSRADRYMYIPSIGLFLLLAWCGGEAFTRWRGGKRILPVICGLALAGCFAATSIQLVYWQNSRTLSQHAIDVTQNNYVAYESLGRALNDAGLKDEALACYEKSVQIEAEFPQSQFNLAVALQDRGQLPDAIEHFTAAVRLVPNSYETHYGLGSALLALNHGHLDEAATQFTEALRLNPDSVDAHHSLAVTYALQGNLTNALPHFAEAVRLNPTNADLRFGFGLALLDTHQPATAAAQFIEELKLAPNETRAHYRLAQALQQQGQLPDAVAHYQAALKLTPNFPEAKAALDQILAAHPELQSSTTRH